MFFNPRWFIEPTGCTVSIRSLFVVISAFLLAGTSTCAEYRKEITGPDALSYWAYQPAMQRHPGVLIAGEEVLRLERELIDKVNRYIETHSEVPDNKKAQLRKLTVHVGMIKEEVRLLLGDPSEVLRSPETLQGMAKDEWKDTEEAWVYRSYAGEKYYYPYVLYFRADTITQIIKIIPPIWWL